MKNTMIYLIGYPGVGKLTVARELCARTGARLLDNHLVNNVVFSLLERDGSTPIPAPAWDEIKHIRDAALRIVAQVAKPYQSFVLTNVLLDDDDDRALLAQVQDTAAQRGARFVPVVLDCHEAENLRRLVTPERATGMKWTDAAAAAELRHTQPLIRFSHPNRLDVDITRQPPSQSADEIIAHIERLP
jgi:predicted kinase